MDAERCNEYDNAYDHYYSLNKLIFDKRDAGVDQKLKISLVWPNCALGACKNSGLCNLLSLLCLILNSRRNERPRLHMSTHAYI